MKRLCVLALFFVSAKLLANNVQINNLTVVGDDPINGHALVQFDLSWDNSWRNAENWDAVWLFVKYRANNGEWRHAWLNNTGNSDGSGTNAVMDIGFKNDKLPFNETTNPGIGCMVYRSAEGAGSFFVTSMQLRWNYRTNGVFSSTGVELKVFAIEMVLIPGGSFWVGDGLSEGTLRQTGSNTPVQISSLATVIKCQDTFSDDTQLEGAGIWISGVGGISRSDATATNVNPDFPTGFTGFYCMKYELSQGQYRDFLNTLTRAQQNLHTTTDISGTSVDNRYIMTGTTVVSARNSLRCDGILPAEGPIEIYCDLDGDGEKNEMFDGEWLACNYISWTHRTAYLDWSGLRPMTELEFEKACRGPVAPVAGEYPWGTTAIANTRYTLSNSGTAFEGIAQGYSTTAGNAYYSSTHNANSGTEPLRVGIFAAHSSNNGRVASGAGYYGVMELGGNVAETTITIGNFSGRSFTGINGDGELASNGEPNVSLWPGPYLWANGFGHRAAPVSAQILRTSDRNESSFGTTGIGQGRGLRGCRSVPVNGSGY